MNREIKRAIRAVERTIERFRDPSNWTQGTVSEKRGRRVCRCLIGQLGHEANAPPYSLPSTLVAPLVASMNADQRMRAQSRRSLWDEVTPLYRFNDNPNTKLPEVVALLRRGLTRLKRQLRAA